MQKKVYDNEFKVQVVKLGAEVGFSKRAKELGINTDTFYGWNKCAKVTVWTWELVPGYHYYSYRGDIEAPTPEQIIREGMVLYHNS